MERRSRSLLTPLELFHFWLRDYGLALSVVAVLCASFAGLLIWVSSTTRGAERLEDATVVRFGYYDSTWVHRPLVLVRMRDGKVRQLAADPQLLRHCQAGDTIMLVRRGAGLFVDRRGCRGPGAPKPRPRSG